MFYNKRSSFSASVIFLCSTPLIAIAPYGISHVMVLDRSRLRIDETYVRNLGDYNV